MNLRQRLLLVFSLTVIIAVGAVGYIVSLRTREAFAQADQERTSGLVAQFHREFDRRGADVKARLGRMAASDEVSRIAFDLGRGGDSSIYLSEAGTLAQQYGLDFLEMLGPDGSIISSAQWQARFGYKETIPENSSTAFLKREELTNGSAVGLFAVKTLRAGDTTVYLVGGERLDREFLQSLATPVGTQALLYRVGESGFQSQNLIGLEGAVVAPEKYRPLLMLAMHDRKEVSAIVAPTADRKDSLYMTAIPLSDRSGQVVSVLMIGSPRRGLIELQDHIRAVALTVGGLGILLAIAVSLWITGRVTRPIVELANASRQVAAGELNVSVSPHGASGEVAELAEAFNRMTSQLLEQRERLVQSERVAAWRELARRLAHELKNPLFPLQLTVENMVKAREVMPEEFDEIFHESATTLMAEIQNLKGIIQRFSDFSKMPQPQLQAVKVNEIVERVATLHAPALANREHPVKMEMQLDAAVPVIAADPELLHRSLSNLVLNALDAMPQGGTITMRTAAREETVRIEVADTGTGLTKEECERLFTPYYTTKQHGTGLGLAIVQSVITDHGGTIGVESAPGQGATFIIELPRRTAASGTTA
ncbi:periplasmic sensor signal transduction histidine kinase [Candidatus Koribacter versatilis Ellin345]|uniref:histidine kinase n=1 Tax=Koribacter versatilis (strain Ellin345) TaxID=204669 RepID=Q1IQW6_KORVE|nr:ATP-binding protein [Candidatus Koribacter versatilis]ABF40734.1 periplasmic sensor signal transduction histidine kinase [Candidatus Koribacter versatilis Ellin345]